MTQSVLANRMHNSTSRDAGGALEKTVLNGNHAFSFDALELSLPSMSANIPSSFSFSSPTENTEEKDGFTFSQPPNSTEVFRFSAGEHHSSSPSSPTEDPKSSSSFSFSTASVNMYSPSPNKKKSMKDTTPACERSFDNAIFPATMLLYMFKGKPLPLFKPVRTEEEEFQRLLEWTSTRSTLTIHNLSTHKFQSARKVDFSDLVPTFDALLSQAQQIHGIYADNLSSSLSFQFLEILPELIENHSHIHELSFANLKVMDNVEQRNNLSISFSSLLFKVQMLSHVKSLDLSGSIPLRVPSILSSRQILL